MDYRPSLGQGLAGRLQAVGQRPHLGLYKELSNLGFWLGLFFFLGMRALAAAYVYNANTTNNNNKMDITKVYYAEFRERYYPKA